MPLGGGPRPRRRAQPGATTGPGTVGPVPTTASGLARRTPVDSPAAATTAGPPVDAALLAALGRVTYAGSQASDPARRAPSPPVSAPTDADRHATAPEALARRVRGAQMPHATVVTLRGSRTPQNPTEPPSRLARGASKATDVQTLLADFSAGVQRGLAEARERAPLSGEVPAVDVRQRSGERR